MPVMPIKRWHAVIDGETWEEFTVDAKTEVSAQRELKRQLAWCGFYDAMHRWEEQCRPVSVVEESEVVTK